jgi:hypothetical protein
VKGHTPRSIRTIVPATGAPKSLASHPGVGSSAGSAVSGAVTPPSGVDGEYSITATGTGASPTVRLSASVST